MIYLDNAATTKTSSYSYDAMHYYFQENYANPSSGYQFSKEPKMAIEESRKSISYVINVKPEEIYFTSGGTESDNWAIRGVFFANQNKGKHIITTNIEHPAVLNTCKYLEEYFGASVTYVKVDKDGYVDQADIENAITDETILISVMAANNEIGTIQPIEEISRIAKKHGVLFHTDAVQGFCHMEIDASEIDLLSASGHKFNGPKGVGFLYIKNGTNILPFVYGGGQESGMRSGTENVPGIVGIGHAASTEYSCPLAFRCRVRSIKSKSNYIIDEITNSVNGVKINGGKNRLVNNINFLIDGVDGESLMGLLDSQDVFISTGSACSTSSGHVSHVLSAIGLTDEQANSSVRITLSYNTTWKDIDEFIKLLKQDIEILRGR